MSSDPARLLDADIIIVAVPTPVDIAHNRAFGPLIGASEFVGKHMRRGAAVVYELVAAVAHRQLQVLSTDHLRGKLVHGGCFIDVKACFDAAALRKAGLRVWRL